MFSGILGAIPFSGCHWKSQVTYAQVLNGGVKHLVERILAKAPSGSSEAEIANATTDTINKFGTALASATKDGYEYNTKIYDASRKWEFIIKKPTNQSIPNPRDAVIHAVYNAGGFK